MSYGYPPAGQGQGYPPQQGGYPGGQGGYPGQAPGAYPPTGAPGGYPPSTGAPGGYPPAPGAPGGYPPAAGAPGYPPQQGGYPPQGGYPGGPPAAGGIGFEGLGAQAGGPPQHPAQNYGQPGAMPYGGGAPPQAPYGGGYPQTSAPAPGYQTQPNYGAPPAQQPYGAPPQQGYGAPPASSYPSAPMPGSNQLYGQPPAQQAYGQPPHTQAAYSGSQYGKPGKMAQQLSSGMAAMTIKTHGTVTPYPNFNPEHDAQVLRKAMKKIGTDEKAIIEVIGKRTNKQRQEIKIKYKQSYGRDLVKDFKSEVSGNFEDVLCGLMMTPREYDAYCLRKAVSGVGTTESTLVEILVSRTNQEIKEIQAKYKELYKENLEKRLVSETSGHFKKLLVSLNNACRDETSHVDQNKAREDANKLYQAGEKKWGTDESTFNMIMASRSMPQLRATFEEYYKIANRDIIKSVKGEFSGDVEDGMVAVIEVARNPAAYFARRLHESMKGAGTKDHILIRVVVSRSEVDMVEIKRDFQAMYKIPLAKYIGDDTGGDYKKILLSIVGH
ncbi:annexin-B12-like [Ciona intestinalis]